MTAYAFSLPVRVYYQDTDAGGVVFHANYLSFLERARTEWLRHLGFDLREMAERHDVLFIVREANVRYRRPALLDDLLDVTVKVERLGRAQFTLGQDVLRSQEELVCASINVACVSCGSFKPLRLPQRLYASLATVLEHEDQPKEQV
ncbi:MAG TPA: tol-pal system-associated acyl-CoA thioesterase [Burkholderiales bacterium]|nr:tol-pal system-associated acyl-CoA thioesterase [Burkholderiales bacterium]